jgi:predicted TIM-barrel fold metal-dependent hydrolase
MLALVNITTLQWDLARPLGRRWRLSVSVKRGIEMAKSYPEERKQLKDLLPDPEPAVRRWPIISVDDHFVEPGDLFVNHLPSKFLDIAPRIVPTDDGGEVWKFPDELVPNLMTTTSIVGRPVEEWGFFPLRLDECRPGTYDVHARVADLDLAGIAASLCFPSFIFGFVGQRLHNLTDPDLAFACFRAYNDWIAEDWVGMYPDRFIPQQLPWMPDPKIAAAEIRRNADRGFKAVSFSESPEKLGYPSPHTKHWWPFFEACEETETVVNLHIGSSSRVVAEDAVSSDCPGDVLAAMFGVNALLASVDWVYSGVPSHFPRLKIVLSESGIDWVPYVIDRLKRHAYTTEMTGSWADRDLSPIEVFQRNFWFTTLEDPLGFELRDHIGVDRIMVECDYPHPDTQWPNIQDRINLEIGHLPADEISLITHGTASAVYRHKIPTLLSSTFGEI